ncbi:hypothetical protein GEMRC1_012180 [Eukaryota sp. GEM-RC1]
MAIDGLKKSPHFESFTTSTLELEDCLRNYHHLFEGLNSVQSDFVQLCSIFQVYPLDFRGSDVSWISTKKKFIQYMCQLSEIDTIASLPDHDVLESIKSDFNFLKEQVRIILSRERCLFPRLFFLGDIDLLTALAVFKSNIAELNVFLPKIFPGTNSLIIKQNSIIGVKCIRGDFVYFENYLEFNSLSTLSEFLLELQKNISSSLSNLFSTMSVDLFECLNLLDLTSSTPNDFSKCKDLVLNWLETTPSQLIWLCLLHSWTTLIERILDNDGTFSNLHLLFVELVNIFTRATTNSNILVQQKAKAYLPEIYLLKTTLQSFAILNHFLKLQEHGCLTCGVMQNQMTLNFPSNTFHFLMAGSLLDLLIVWLELPLLTVFFQVFSYQCLLDLLVIALDQLVQVKPKVFVS